jgi:YjbR
MTANIFRQLALRCGEAVEGLHMRHPDFRIGGKVFASLGAPDASWGMVKLTPEQQREFIADAPDVFVPCSGAWGRKGYTNVCLAAAEAAVVQAALETAASNVGG